MDQANKSCSYLINGGGGPGARQLDPRTFEHATGIPCEEIVPDAEPSGPYRTDSESNGPYRTSPSTNESPKG